MIIGILRGFDRSLTVGAIDAAVRGGLRMAEITWNSPGAGGQISEARERFEGRCAIGAGTVLSVGDLEGALNAGAEFVVTPVLREEVVVECVRRGVPIYPGAFSPGEVERAWGLGAAMVKVFPAEVLGPAYIKALKGPFPGIKLMPTGGVDLESLGLFAKAGASGFGVGGPLFNKARVEARDWAWIEGCAAKFTDCLRNLAR